MNPDSRVRSQLVAVGSAMLAGALLVTFVGWPIGMVVERAASAREVAGPGLTLADERTDLALETLALVALTLAISLPVGVASAVLLFRTDTPARRLIGAVCVLPALVPIELHATAWLAGFGTQGLAAWAGLPIELRGLFGAAWIHAMVALPWVIGIVGVATLAVEPELEEDCLTLAGPLVTLWHVTLRRSAGAIVAAALFVSVLTAGEMGVTDLLQVRTYAETVYVEFAVTYRVGVAAATALPGLAVLVVAIAAAGALVGRLAPRDSQVYFTRRPIFALQRWRWPALVVCAIVAASEIGVPAANLVWRAGLVFPKERAEGGPHWSPMTLATNVTSIAARDAGVLGYSLGIAAMTSLVAVAIALWLALAARDSRWGRALTGATACVLLALPGAVLGMGLKLAIDQPSRWWRGESLGGRIADAIATIADSAAVLVWLHVLRVLPFALVVMWPAVRMVNRSLLELAALDGLNGVRRFLHVELPSCRPAACAAALVAMVLSLGELGGSVLVAPPGTPPLSVRIFQLAHFGVREDLAALCLVLLVVIAGGAVAAGVALRWAFRGEKEGDR